MPALARRTYTPEEYLDLERKAEFRSEYLNGYLYPRSGANIAHNTITVNLTSVLGTKFVGCPYIVLGSDMRVEVQYGSFYAYPDAMALCDKPVLTDSSMDTLTNPTVLFEVLSPSTEAYDRGQKFELYRKIESLQEYVLVAQDRAFVEHYVRRGNKWELSDISSLDDTLQMDSIQCELLLRDIYDRVDFPIEPENTSNNGARRP